MNRVPIRVVVPLALSALACAFFPPSGLAPTPSPVSPPPPTTAPTAEDTATPAEPASPTALPAGAGPCQASATSAFDVYLRPALLSEPFGTFAPDFGPVRIASRTEDGWLGFDPGVPQAANIGVFRMRWIPPGAPVSLTGDCAAAPVEPWIPTPGVCYQMSMGPVEIHASPNPASPVAYTLMIEEFVAVTGRTGTGWLFVNGDSGNVPGIVGFIPEAEMNANGPCDALPVLSP